MLLLHSYMSPPKSGTFGAIGSGDSGLKPRRLRSDQSLRTKPRRLRPVRRLRCVWSGDSGLGLFAGFIKGLGVGSCFTTPLTPPLPKLAQPPPSAPRSPPAAPRRRNPPCHRLLHLPIVGDLSLLRLDLTMKDTGTTLSLL